MIKIRIKNNTKNKAKWYYGWINKERNLADKILTVKESENPWFDNHFDTYLGGSTGSSFISKDDCEVLK